MPDLAKAPHGRANVSRPDARTRLGVAASTLSTPSLASGGGAIRGIGEQFQVSALTGTVSAGVPLGLTPGRAGFTPQLALSYDSGAGNGPFGLGWSVSVPAVSRRTDRGVPRYRDGDTFVLAGADDLVPALRQTAEGWTPVTRAEGAFEVRRYRPRTEGGFARIERWTERASGDVHWRVTSPDNVTSIFGRTAAARVADPADPRRVFTWLLEEVFDDRGNVAVYDYKAEDLAGADHAERARAAGPQPQRYLKRVRYGNAAPGVRDGWHFEAVLDYGEHDHEAPTPNEVRAWPHRADPFRTGRPGFEVTTRRLCRRVLMFHRFDELGAEPCLVRATELRHAEDPVATLLVAVTQAGFTRLASGRYERAALPPVDFEYTTSAGTGEVGTLDRGSLEHLPYGLDGRRYQWLDLAGDGVAGVLSEDAGEWRFSRNLGGGRLAAPEPVAHMPNVAGRGSVLSDLEADGGLSVVTLGAPEQGYSERTTDGNWAPFTPFRAAPNLSWSDPNLRAVDLTGDGRTDVLVSCDGVLRWHRSLGRDGYAEEEVVAWAVDEEDGPRPVFADDTVAIQLADMTGDGLPDLVRVASAEVCYWPNLGHGRFGPRVVLRDAPVLDLPGRFDPSRVRLFDVDGTGAADLIYLGPDAVRAWPNQAGRSFGAERRLDGIPPLDDASSVSVVDLLGTGTASLVWSTALPTERGRHVRYVELTGGVKPLLLGAIRNNLGGETRVTYAPSTRFFLEDAAAGRPWATGLPFPVHVVERVQASDGITGCHYTTSYRYRHGFYDRREREFRGFACVETTDVESFEAGGGAELDSMPALTRTWYHTGAYLEGGAIARALADEYYDGDARAAALPDTILPPGIAPTEEPDAVRALRGVTLRTEVYGLDGSARSGHPYSVTESSYRLRLVQPGTAEAPPVLHPHAGETLTYQYERRADDPRVSHQLALEVDEFGAPSRSATVAYARRAPAQPEQAQTVCTLAEAAFLHHANDGGLYRLGVPLETRAYELTGLPEPEEGPYTFDVLRAAAAGARELPFDAPAAGGAAAKRLLGRTRTRYLRDDLSGPLPFGDVESLALVFESYALAAPETLVASVFGDRLDPGALAEGGYVRDGGAWWAPSGRIHYDRARFLQPTGATDPFGNRSRVEYDRYALQPVAAVDPLGNTVRAQLDYRTLAPVEVTDQNGNRSAVRTDPLGRVVAAATMGKPGAGEGDTLDDPTARFEYSDHEYAEHGRPAFARSIHRETHGPGAALRHAFAYTDGLGRLVMTKAQAEPGPAPARAPDGSLLRKPDGSLVLGQTAQRWVGSGRTVFDRKGNPVRQYEPFFSSTSAYESEAELVETGVTPTLRYDPLGRVIRTDNPDGTYGKVEFDAWRVERWDTSDTIRDSLWLVERGGLDPADPQARAARLAEAHAATPSVIHLDPLGREVLGVADNGPDGRLEVRTTLDVAGNVLAVTDARGNRTVTQVYDALNRPLRAVSTESGGTLTLRDVAGVPIRSFNARGFAMRPRLDALRRPTHLMVSGPDGSERLVQRVLYGEALPDAAMRNLRGAAFRTYDTAGVATVERVDFNGNALETSRRLVRDFRRVPDWSGLADIEEPAAVAATAEGLLEAETFAARTEYDALGRPVKSIGPDGSEQRPVYNEAGLLERLDLRLPGAAAPVSFVAGVEYEADGRRARIEYGNGVATGYAYDPRSRRLIGLATRRPSDGAILQDLRYVHDPVGNVVQVTDGAQQTLFFRNAVVPPTALYEYDPLGRLRVASGREHAGAAQVDHADTPAAPLPHPNDAAAVRTYSERYAYDAAGNLTEVRHIAAGGSWTRRYAYESTSNRLAGTSLPGDPPAGPLGGAYAHDSHGNLTRMPHLAALDWDFAERLVRVDLGGGGAAHYSYDAAGERIRAVVERQGGLTEERLYFGGFELFRRRTSGGALTHERSTLHVADDAGRIALVETETRANGAPVAAPTAAIRYQLGNHLGSACLELDEGGALVSYEEYHPYGTAAYRSGRSAAEVSRKRYRFTGKERDAETGFTYHGARYYAPWLGRWTATDPAGLVDGPNVYAYARANPVMFSDPGGTQSAPCDPSAQTCVQQPAAESVNLETQTVFPIPPYMQRFARDPSAKAAAELESYLESTPFRINGEVTLVYGDLIWVGEREKGKGYWYFSYQTSPTSDTNVEAEGYKIRKPGLLEGSIPVIGSLWESAAEIERGNWGWGLFHAGMAAVDVLTLGVGAKVAMTGARAATALGRATAAARASVGRALRATSGNLRTAGIKFGRISDFWPAWQTKRVHVSGLLERRFGLHKIFGGRRTLVEMTGLPSLGGGRVWVSGNEIGGGHVRKLLRQLTKGGALSRGGKVHVISGRHGPSDLFVREWDFVLKDIAMFTGKKYPNVEIHDFYELSKAELTEMLEGADDVILAWCFSDETRSVANLLVGNFW